MKYIAKMMLALLASVTLVIPAYAWDFSASGSMSASFNSTSTKAAKNAAYTTTSGGVTSEGSSLVLKSSNTDGEHTATFSYTADWDDDLDQTIKVAGSKKVGKWTASADVAYNIDQPGCTATNGDNTTATVGCAQQTGEDRGAITLTDGTMTIVLGEASHLAGQNVDANSVAGGSVSMDAADEDLGVGAFVGSFHGVSLGYKISDTMSVTVAYQSSGDASDLLGEGEYLDGESSYSTSGAGVGASVVAGPATIGVTVGNASTKDATGVASLSTSMSTTGLGVKIDLGDIDPFFDYGSTTIKGSSTSSEYSHSGMELGLTYAMGSDSVVFYYGTVDDKFSATDTATKTTGLELGYNTTVGPVALGVGYGTKSKSDADDTAGTVNDGYSYSDIDVTMSMSF
jgi:hypothetical protein